MTNIRLIAFDEANESYVGPGLNWDLKVVVNKTFYQNLKSPYQYDFLLQTLHDKQ